MEEQNLESCFLARGLFTKQIPESRPIGNVHESDHYFLDIRWTRYFTRVWQCKHGYYHDTIRKVKPEVALRRLPDAWLDRPFEYVTIILRQLRLRLQDVDVETMVDFLVGLRNKARPETREVVCVEIIVHWIRRMNRCLAEVPITQKETVDVHSEWIPVSDDRLLLNGRTVDEIVLKIIQNDYVLKLDLPTVKYGGTGEDTCSICFYKFSEGDEIVKTSCSHYFHQDCIGNWMMRKINCPLCRSPLIIGFVLG